MSSIYLIRHGKTDANLRRLYCGSTDLPLSALGTEELRQLDYQLHARRYVTSGMLRTNQTLKLLFGDVPFEEDPALREVDFGVFEMHSYEELKDRADYQLWLSGCNEENIPPHGESGAQMTRRALEAFRRYQAQGADTVIVSHGGVIAAIMAQLFPQEGKNRYQWQPQCGHGYRLDGIGYQAI